MQCREYIREARHGISFANLFIVIMIGFLLFPAVVCADAKVTVGIVGFIPKTENTTIPGRINWIQARIMEILADPNYQADIIFEPEYMLSHDYDYLECPNYPNDLHTACQIKILKSSDNYILEPFEYPESSAIVDHIYWLMEKAREYQVGFFTNVWESIDLAPYGEIGTAKDQTGIMIDRNGKIVGIVRKMIDFDATWEGCPPKENAEFFECDSFNFWKDRLIGPTINSYQLTNKENKGYVVLPILCGDLWSSFILGEGFQFWTDYHTQKLKENNAKKADIVLAPINQNDGGGWSLSDLFEAIENSTFDPENFIDPDGFGIWDAVFEKFIQKYVVENGFIKDDHSYYFGVNAPVHNFAGFELKSFLSGGPQPLAAGRSVVADHYMILNVDLEEIEHKIDPDRVTASSGEIAKMTFGVPSDAVSAKLYMSCPAGLSIGLGTNNNICNSWQTLSLLAHSETRMEFRVTNTTKSVLKAVPNFYIYKASNPNYGYGVSGEITVNPDILPPVVSSANKVAVLAYGTTQTTLIVNTNENAICKYDFNPHKTFSTMQYTYTSTGGTTHSQALTGLVNGGLKTTYTMCQDAQQNVMSTDSLNLYMVRLSTGDVTAPAPVPSNLTAQALSSTQAKLQWNGSTDVSGAVFYRIYRRLDAPNSSFIFVGTATTTTYTDSYYLVKGKKYLYKILAYDSARNLSAFSSETSVTMP